MVGGEGKKPRSLVSVCNDEDMPSYSTVMYWLDDKEKPAFLENYQRAQRFREDAIFEELRDISETPLIGEIVTEKETDKGVIIETKRADNVQRSDLMVKTAMWQLARMAPKKYGDKQAVEHSGSLTFEQAVAESMKKKD